MKRKIISTILALAMILAAIAYVPVSASEVNAARYHFASRAYNLYHPGESEYGTYTIYIYDGVNTLDGMPASEIKNLKSTSKNIQAYARSGGKIKLVMKNKKTSASVSCTVRGQKISVKINVLKAPNDPFKTFKIGSKNYAKQFKKSTKVYSFIPTSKKKVTVKVKSGWIISGYYYNNTGSTKVLKTEINKSSITGKWAFNGETSYLAVNVTHKKSRANRTYVFYYVD